MFAPKIVKVEIRKKTRDPGERRSDKFYRLGIFLWREGESVLDQLVERKNRPHSFVKDIIPQILQDNDITFDINTLKIMWKQNYGCSCGCSPGFDTNIHVPFFIDINYVWADVDDPKTISHVTKATTDDIHRPTA